MNLRFNISNKNNDHIIIYLFSKILDYKIQSIKFIIPNNFTIDLLYNFPKGKNVIRVNITKCSELLA